MLNWTKTGFLIAAITLIIGLNAGADDAWGWGNNEEAVPENLEALGVTNTKVELSKILNSMTLGNNGFYNKVLSPAKSLNLNLSDSDRIQEVNDKIVSEMNAVISAFTNASEDKKLDSVRSLVASIDGGVIKNNGANIQFFNNSPSAAFSRVLMMIEKKSSNARAEMLLNSFSSYKRSAIPNTYFYEYSDAGNISQSTIKTTTGTDLSWKAPLAAPAIKADADLVLKKCRQIFGWKCVTSLYRTGQLLTGKDNIKYFYAGIYNLADNSDNPEFTNDKRSSNQIAGSTALYIIKESAGWLLLYGIDSQWNRSSTMFTSLILDEFIKDSRRVKERLSLDLKVALTDIK